MDDQMPTRSGARAFEPLLPPFRKQRYGSVSAFEVFNLGHSHPVKLDELVDLIESVTGRKAIRDWRPPQPGDVPLTGANISKANRLLGYQPSTSLEEGNTKFVKWYPASHSQ